MPLTDIEVKKAETRDKPYKMFDSGGLHLVVNPSGSKLWRMRYEIGGKEKLLSFGPYPKVGIKAAREARDDARAVLRAGRDPALEQKIRRATAANRHDNFEQVARAWHAQQLPTWNSRQHGEDVIGSLEAHVFPALGKIPIEEITPPMVLTVLRAIEGRPAVETAHRVCQRLSAVFVFAIASGLASTDPAATVRKALKPVVRGRQPAITDLAEVQEMLRRAESVPAHPVTRLALRFLSLTSVRPGEVQAAAWSEMEGLDGTEPLWRIPAVRMKMKREHLVPLARQAVEVIEAVRPLTGRCPYLFPNARFAHRPMSENALGYLLNRAGYHHRHVPHGWRSTFSTIMNERRPADRAVIDLMLAHQPDNAVEAAYNRALHLERRRELAQEWADLLLEGAPPAADLIGLPQR